MSTIEPTPGNYETRQNVQRATTALWLWTAWVCLFGLYESWHQVPELNDLLSQLDGLITISPKSLWPIMVAGYVLLAVVSILVIIGIGRGKNWARSSLMWGVLFQIAGEAFPPYHIVDFIKDIPDLGLQIFATYMLYTPPGNGWFERKKS